MGEGPAKVVPDLKVYSISGPVRPGNYRSGTEVYQKGPWYYGIQSYSETDCISRGLLPGHGHEAMK